MRGTPYIYQGDEIGMVNYPFKSIDECEDIQTVNNYKERVIEGTASLEDYLEFTRDHARTPMQWKNDRNAGFSDADPWLAVHPNYPEVNVSAEIKETGSILHYYRRMIQIRKSSQTLCYGDFKILDYPNESIFSYQRQLGDNSYLIILNFDKSTVDFSLPYEIDEGALKWVIGNYDEQPLIREKIATLKPYEAVVYKC